MYQKIISLDEVTNALFHNHKIVNIDLLNKAYSYALKMHKDQFRKSGEAYIYHPLRVAKMIALWGFDLEMVVAALLHDIVEDCNITIEEVTAEFGKNIASIVDTLTSVNKELKFAQNISKEELDKLSDLHLITTMSKQALFIKVADRIDNLQTIDVMPREKQIGKVFHTRRILLPFVMKLEAYELVDILEELCFKIEHNERYDQIISKYQSLLSSNSVATKKTLEGLSQVFLSFSKSYLIPKQLQPYMEYVYDFKYNPRSIISIFRQVSRQACNLDKELSKLLAKENIALYDLTLIIDSDKLPSDVRIIDVFFQYYKVLLSEQKICIKAYNQKTSHGDSSYLILVDEMRNLYRLFIKSNKDYMKYRLGQFLDFDDNIAIMEVNELEPSDSFNKKIKIFLKNGGEKYIDEGATVLDAAFAISSSTGLYFKYALLDDSELKLNAGTRLNEGDKITIVTDTIAQANLHWFKYIKTNRAIQYLINYLEKN